MSSFIPYGTQWIDDDDIAAVVSVLKNGFLTQGPKITEFETAIAQKVGAKFCVVFCNATGALHCAVNALNIPKGKQGITSPNTFVASANCLPYNQLIPVFADIDPKTFNITAESIQQKINVDTAVIIPVHFAGQPCDMQSIGALAQKHGIPVIEDAAHAIGSQYPDGSMVGSCSNSVMTIFSFHPVKTMTTGEGGAITTNDETIYKKLLLLRSHGITKDSACLSQNPGPWYYEQQDLGYNYRITDMQCALGISQLSKLDRFKELRREIINRYNNAFRDIPNIQIPFESPGLSSCFHLYTVQIDFKAIGKTRQQVMKELAEQGVGSQVLYIPVYTHPWYQQTYGYSKGMCPNAELYYENALSLPLFPKMSLSDIETVIQKIIATLSTQTPI